MEIKRTEVPLDVSPQIKTISTKEHLATLIMIYVLLFYTNSAKQFKLNNVIVIHNTFFPTKYTVELF